MLKKEKSDKNGTIFDSTLTERGKGEQDWEGETTTRPTENEGRNPSNRV
jgi:hypothetical protein